MAAAFAAHGFEDHTHARHGSEQAGMGNIVRDSRWNGVGGRLTLVWGVCAAKESGSRRKGCGQIGLDPADGTRMQAVYMNQVTEAAVAKWQGELLGDKTRDRVPRAPPYPGEPAREAALQRPDSSYARASTLLRDDGEYVK